MDNIYAFTQAVNHIKATFSYSQNIITLLKETNQAMSTRGPDSTATPITSKTNGRPCFQRGRRELILKKYVASYARYLPRVPGTSIENAKSKENGKQ